MNSCVWLFFCSEIYTGFPCHKMMTDKTHQPDGLYVCSLGPTVHRQLLKEFPLQDLLQMVAYRDEETFIKDHFGVNWMFHVRSYC